MKRKWMVRLAVAASLVMLLWLMSPIPAGASLPTASDNPEAEMDIRSDTEETEPSEEEMFQEEEYPEADLPEEDLLEEDVMDEDPEATDPESEEPIEEEETSGQTE